MIQIESICINEFRGIKNLTLDMGKNNFAICGPNGTGKSGVIDAIEFALTGSISRLSGEGMGNVSTKEHAPHVDSRSNPAKSSVELTVFIPSLNKSAKIIRTVKGINSPQILPNDDDIVSALAGIASHPEFALTRRELMKYVLSAPGKRAEEVQSLLRLDKIEKLRTTLNKISNTTERSIPALEKLKIASRNELLEALDITEFSSANILEAVNIRRAILGLQAIEIFDANTSIKDGIVSLPHGGITSKIPKAQALADIKISYDNISSLCNETIEATCKSIKAEISAIVADTEAIRNITKENLFNISLAEFDEKQCPVCDTPWEPEKFRTLLLSKTKRLEEAKKKRSTIVQAIKPIIDLLESVQNSFPRISAYALLLTPPVQPLAFTAYLQNIQHDMSRLRNSADIVGMSTALDSIYCCPSDVTALLNDLEKAITALPDPSKQDGARDYLILAQERLEKYRQAARNLAKAQRQAEISKHIYELYGTVVTQELESIYKQVENSFVELYRDIHHEDENTFLARLAPSIGKLGFDVDFYGRGYFPPGAYHSEGHQDGMGLCLYLALMKYIFDQSFTFAVLDDVLMSVDAGHRRDVSRLFKKHFPTVQFIMTTHDEVWLKSMQTEGLIDRKHGFIFFKSWNVDCGPTEWDDRDVWNEISGELKKSDVRSAASLLRNYLEYISKEFCHRLHAPVVFRGDGEYTLGDLLPNAVSRLSKLLSEGKTAEDSWGNTAVAMDIENRRKELAQANVKSEIEKWQTNKAIHYNEWANFHKNDFEPVVTSFCELISHFRCKNCNGMLYVVPDRGTKQALRCSCAQVNINLNKKTN